MSKARNYLLKNHYCYCVYCGCQLFCCSVWGKKLTVDHKLALSQGGKNNKGNWTSSCNKCNSRKGKMGMRTHYNGITGEKL